MLLNLYLRELKFLLREEYNNIYLPDLNRETYGIINNENLVDIRINISLLNQPIEEIYKHFMNASS